MNYWSPAETPWPTCLYTSLAAGHLISPHLISVYFPLTSVLFLLYIDKPEDISPAEEPPTAEKAPGDEPQSDSGGYMFDQWSRT